MTPKWLTSIKSSLSPKVWLAKRIAHVLNEFFVLDGSEEQIESNLLTDTKIVLRNLRVRPRQIHHPSNIWLYGTVKEVEFSWKWTKSAKKMGEGTFVKKTKLAIRGARFRIVLGDEGPAEAVSDSASMPFSLDSTADSQEGYIQRQIQQIMDHLSFDISDVELVVEDKANTSYCAILVQAKQFQLVALGRSKNKTKVSRSRSTVRSSLTRAIKKARRSSSTSAASQSTKPLSHRITLESVCASVLLEPMNTSAKATLRLPLLEPIGYGATMKRVAGRHILDGWETGVNIVGEILSSTAEGGLVVVHAGKNQIATVGRLVERLISLRRTGNVAGVANTKKERLPMDDSSSSISEDAPTTTVEFPIPAIIVMLPESSAIRTPQCSFTCHVDGSVCRFNGSEGVWVDQKPLLLFHGGNRRERTCSGKWLVDFVACKVSLMRATPQEPIDAVAQIKWEDVVMKQLVREILLLASTVAEFIPKSTAPYPNSQRGRAIAPKWAFESVGAILLNVSCKNEWLIAKVSRPSIQICTDNRNPRVTEMSLAGIDVGPTSLGKTRSTKFHIPAVKLQEGAEGELWSQGIIVDGSVSGVLESIQVVETLVECSQALIAFPQNEPQIHLLSTSNETGRPLHLYLRVPRATLQICSLDAELVAESIISRSPFDQVRCRSLEIYDTHGFVLALAGIKAGIHPNLSAKISSIDDFHVPGICRIERPVKTLTKVSHKGGKLHIEAPQLRLRLLDGPSTQNRTPAKATLVEPLKLPFPILCVCPTLEVRQSILGGLTTCISKMECHLVPFESSVVTKGPLSSSQSVAVQLLVGAVENKFAKLGTTTASGVIKTNDFSAIHQFCLAMQPVEVRAGPTSMDLKSLFDCDVAENADPIWFPDAVIGSVDVNLRWKGPVIGTKRTLSTIPAFEGGPKTNSSHFINYYKKAMVERVAATITDNKLLGPKVSKMSAKTAGAVLTGSEKVVGGVRDAISTGKKSRNAKPGAKYKFGDFARGTIHQAINDIKKTEAEIRRNSELFAESISRRASQI